jgi:DNA-binding GntR family transcriptional regulator
MSQNEASPDFGGELLSATVKRLVLDRIIQGHYRPGERIVEFKLAKELGLSQSPVREGLRELAAVGIVTIHPRRGARVRLPSAKELADVSLVRAEIDALAARLAAGPTAAYAGIKRELNGWLFARMEEQLELEAAIQQESAASGDFQEGVLAFLQKRPPEFTGR